MDDFWEMSDEVFEVYCQQLLEAIGFVTDGDGPVKNSLIAHNTQSAQSGKYLILYGNDQVMLERSAVQKLYDLMQAENASKGMYITTGFFDDDTVSWAEGKNLDLIDFQEFRRLLEVYDIIPDENTMILEKKLCSLKLADFQEVCTRFLRFNGFAIDEILECTNKGLFLTARDPDTDQMILFLFFQNAPDLEIIKKAVEKYRDFSDLFCPVGNIEWDSFDLFAQIDFPSEAIMMEEFLECLRNAGIISGKNILGK